MFPPFSSVVSPLDDAAPRLIANMALNKCVGTATCVVPINGYRIWYWGLLVNMNGRLDGDATGCGVCSAGGEVGVGVGNTDTADVACDSC